MSDGYTFLKNEHGGRKLWAHNGCQGRTYPFAPQHQHDGEGQRGNVEIFSAVPKMPMFAGLRRRPQQARRNQAAVIPVAIEGGKYHPHELAGCTKPTVENLRVVADVELNFVHTEPTSTRALLANRDCQRTAVTSVSGNNG